MCTIILSIGIITIPSRQDELKRLLNVLSPQLTKETELLIESGEGWMGPKRQRNLERCSGKYLVHIDDDDLVSTNYIQEILSAINNNNDADCVDIIGEMTNLDTGRKRRMECFLSHKDFGARRDEAGNKIIERPISQINPIATDVLRIVRFPNRNVGEDQELAWKLRDSGMLRSTAKTNSVLYQYLWRANKY